MGAAAAPTRLRRVRVPPTARAHLPIEQWQILAALGELHAAQRDDGQARAAVTQASEIVQALATKIDDPDLRDTFRTAVPVQRLL